MKGNHPCFTLLGNNSGRNLGDAAILSAIMDALAQEMPDAEFIVPTISTKFVDDNYGEAYNVKGVSVWPWTLSIRLLGLPTMRAMAKSDATLICDGIIFGKKLFNPAFNFLVTLIFLAPWAKLCGSKLICYNTGIGPFPGYWSSKFARFVINSCDLVMMRESDSIKLAEKIGVTVPMEITGDSAFINPVSSRQRAKEIAKSESIDLNKNYMAVNITSYIDSWLENSQRVGDKDAFLEELANGILDAKAKAGFEPLLFSTQPMDEEYVYRFAKRIDAKVIDNSKYLSHDIQAMMRECELLVGMRFHSIVLAAAVDVPIVGLIYAPKVRSFMRDVDCVEFGLELADITAEHLSERLVTAWNGREELLHKQKPIVERFTTGAKRAAKLLRDAVCGDSSRSEQVEQKRAANS